MKKVTIDSMMNRNFLDSMMNRNFLGSRIRFEDVRSEPKEISLEQLAENKEDTVFYTNFNGGTFYSKDIILEICELYDLKVVYWDYVRMLAKVEGIDK